MSYILDVGHIYADMDNSSKYKRLAVGAGTLVLSYIGEKLLDSTGVYNKTLSYIANSDSTWLRNALVTQFPVWKIIIFLLTVVISFLIMRLLTSNIRQKRKLAKQRNIDKSLNDLKNKFKQAYTYMHIYDSIAVKNEFEIKGDRVYGLRVELYCKAHNDRIKMMKDSIMGYVCPIGNCRSVVKDSFTHNEFERIYKIVESALQNNWEKTYVEFSNEVNS